MHLLVSSKENVSYFLVFCYTWFPYHSEKNMNRGGEVDSKHRFNELQNIEFIFILSPSGKPMCIAF